MIQKIVSGGQTGADRAALDCAMGIGFDVGGWCPKGRRAEDGRIDDSYPLIETESRNYAVRTRWNARDSDGTLILSPLPLTGGTALTESLAESQRKPVLCIDLNQPENAENRFAEWIAQHRIRVLNVAGPRASSDPQLYDRCLNLLKNLLGPFAPEQP